MTFPLAGGIGIAIKSPDAPGRTPLDYFGPVLRDAARRAWAEYRPKLTTFLDTVLGTGDLMGRGVTLYDRDIRIAEDISFSAERDGSGDLIIHVTTGGNYIEATCTQPTDLGSWADPRFSFAFGLDLTYRIDLPALTKPLTSTGFQTIHVVSPKIDSHGIVADVVFVIDDVVKWITGTDYIKKLEEFIARTDFANYANEGLKDVNAKLTELAGKGYYFLESTIDRLDGGSGSLHGLSIPGAPADRLDLLLTCHGFDRSGVIEGEVHWPKTLGAPTTSRLVVGSTVSAVVRDFRAATLSHAVASPAGEWRALDAAASPGVDGNEPAESSPVAAKLAVLAPDVASQVSTEMRAGAASPFISLIGEANFKALRDEFIHGRDDLAFSVSTPVGGVGLFVNQQAAGRLATLWEADDETTCRRRFTLVDVVTDAPVSVNVALADRYRWRGEADSVAITPDGWSGTITVRKVDWKSRPHAFDDQVTLNVNGVRKFGMRDALTERGIIIVGGRVGVTRLGEKVALNPQPLPPRDRIRGALRDGREARTVGRVAQAEDLRAVRKWGPVALDVAQERIDVLLGLVRENPSGNGSVTGIDFDIQKATDEIIR